MESEHRKGRRMDESRRGSGRDAVTKVLWADRWVYLVSIEDILMPRPCIPPLALPNSI